MGGCTLRHKTSRSEFPVSKLWVRDKLRENDNIVRVINGMRSPARVPCRCQVA